MKYNNSETIFTWFYDVLNIINNTSMYGKKNDRPSIDEYKKLRYLFCYNIDEYFNLLKNYDICIGERMHGCIASIAVGVPTIVICVDFRMKELCDYHSIPYQLITNINEKISFKKLTELADFTKIHEKHQINFERYKNFFKLNEIPTKYTLK
jgi:polysaccharide pyruvyl transferase WcaK-like protein